MSSDVKGGDMKRFTAILKNKDGESRLSFHSMFKKGSLLNRLDLKREMMVWDIDVDRWEIETIYFDERKS